MAGDFDMNSLLEDEEEPQGGGEAAGGDLKSQIAKQTGLPEEEISDENLSGAQKIMAGAKPLVEAGKNPNLGPKELKAIADPNEAKKQDSPQDLATQQVIAKAIMGLAPALLGYAIGGNRGGAAGAQAGEESIKRYEDLQEKQKQIDVNKLKAQLTADALKQKRDQGDKNLAFKEKALQQTLQNKKDVVQLQHELGKPVADASAEKIADMKSAVQKLDDLQQTVENNKDLFGPVMGRIAEGNPYNTRAKSIQAQTGAVAQEMAKAIHGRAPSETEIKMFQEMLPKNSDTPEVAQAKIDQMKRMVIDKHQATLETLGQTGYRVGNVDRLNQVNPKIMNPPAAGERDGSIFSALTGGKNAVASPAPPPFHTMSNEELKKYLGM